jgi:peptidoglycan/xylan/chitin deacetylase (PgdA/CDA1 family)
MARAFPATVRRIYEDGHTIGTRSEDHPTRFGQLTVVKMRHEIDWGISDVSAAWAIPNISRRSSASPVWRDPTLSKANSRRVG